MTKGRPWKSTFTAKWQVIEPRSSRSFSLSLWERAGERACLRQALHPLLDPPNRRGRNHERFRPIRLDFSSFCRECVFTVGSVTSTCSGSPTARNIVLPSENLKLKESHRG